MRTDTSLMKRRLPPTMRGASVDRSMAPASSCSPGCGQGRRHADEPRGASDEPNQGTDEPTLSRDHSAADELEREELADPAEELRAPFLGARGGAAHGGGGGLLLEG